MKRHPSIAKRVEALVTVGPHCATCSSFTVCVGGVQVGRFDERSFADGAAERIRAEVRRFARSVRRAALRSAATKLRRFGKAQNEVQRGQPFPHDIGATCDWAADLVAARAGKRGGK